MRRQHGLNLYTVRIAAHDVDRYQIPAREIRLPAATVEGARAAGVRVAHIQAGLPPWKPLRRLSLAHTTAETL